MAVVYEVPPGLAPVRNEGAEGAAFEAVAEVGYRGADYVVAAADREGLGRALVEFGVGGDVLEGGSGRGLYHSVTCELGVRF